MEFRVIPGFEDYKVSDTGIVWNCIKNKELNQWQHDCGYMCVDLRKDGKPYKKRVHVLVMLAFFGEKPKGKTDVNHKDGNKQNNNISNLEYCSRSENMKHKHYVLGYKSPRGKRDKCLSDIEIDEIRAMHKSGQYTLKELREYWNLSQGGLCCIIYRCRGYENRGTL